MRPTTLVLGFVTIIASPLFSQTLVDRTVRVPQEDEGTATLAERATVQYGTLAQFEVFTSFSFEDRVLSTGIDFIHQSVSDALKTFKAVHYDHGNGVAAADVDGDELPDLYFTTQIGSNALYRNLGGGRFENITEKAGVGVPDRVSVAPSFGDIDNDGDPDLFVTTVRHGNLLFVNDGKGQFREIATQAGLDYTGHSSGGVFFDFNNDSQLDLYLTNVGVYTINEVGTGGFFRGIDNAFDGHLYPERSETSILYQGNGQARFEDVTRRVGLVTNSWSGDATFVDLNGDTFPDLYVLDMQGDDLFFQNDSGQRFVERTPELFGRTPMGAMGVKFFDYNNDGLLDLIITDMHSDMHPLPVDPLKDEKRKYSLSRSQQREQHSRQRLLPTKDRRWL